MVEKQQMDNNTQTVTDSRPSVTMELLLILPTQRDRRLSCKKTTTPVNKLFKTLLQYSVRSVLVEDCPSDMDDGSDERYQLWKIFVYRIPVAEKNDKNNRKEKKFYPHYINSFLRLFRN